MGDSLSTHIPPSQQCCTLDSAGSWSQQTQPRLLVQCSNSQSINRNICEKMSATDAYLRVWGATDRRENKVILCHSLEQPNKKKKIIHPCITLIAKLRPTLFNLLEMKRMFCSAYTLRLFDELLSNSAFNYHSHRPSGRHFCLRVWLFDVISNFL